MKNGRIGSTDVTVGVAIDAESRDKTSCKDARFYHHRAPSYSRKLRRTRERPHGSELPPGSFEWRVMKPIPLRNIAVPSPSVFPFLRAQVKNAFKEPTARSVTSRCERARFVWTCAGREYVQQDRIVGKDAGWSECKSPTSAQISNVNSLPETSQTFASTLRRPLSSCRGSFQCRRAFSTTSYHNAWNILGSMGPKKRQRIPQPPQPPTSPLAMTVDSGIGFNGLGRIARPANELKMRCTELDENGNVTMVSGEFKKSELIAKVCLIL